MENETIQEIKELEKKLQSYYKNLKPKSSELIKCFIEANKKIIINKNDEEAGEEINRLDEKLLRDKILSKEDINNITQYCECLVDLIFIYKLNI
jgi:GTPase involved in cell partitioning and DNA repair